MLNEKDIEIQKIRNLLILEIIELKHSIEHNENRDYGRSKTAIKTVIQQLENIRHELTKLSIK